MDGQQYLDQITPTANKHGKFSNLFSNSIGKLLILGVVATILIIIIGSAFKGETHDAKSDLISLKLRLDNFSETVAKYGSYTKSSSLRTLTNTLSSMLNDSKENVKTHLTDAYQFNESKEITEDATAAEAEYFTNLNAELATASTGQSFDRAYARKISLALNHLMDLEYSIYTYASNDDTKNLLSTFYNDLVPIYNSFNNYSE